MKESVVLVHGIWMSGAELWRLRQLLTMAGYECHIFRYSSLRHSPEQNAERLDSFLQTLDSRVVHFVCHSFGGLVLLHLFDRFPQQKPGRIVFLGVPVNGSEVAHRLHRYRASRWLLGRSVEHGLLGDRPEWLRWRELGVIAGTMPIGVGTLLGGLYGPNDGTVTVDETRLAGATDFITLPVGHFGMLYSERVAIQVVTFLRAGKFGDELTNLLMDGVA